MRRGTNAERWPYLVKLPKDAASPTGSIYKRFDIVKQSRVLNTINNWTRLGLTVRSAEPFILCYNTKGRCKQVISRRQQ